MNTWQPIETLEYRSLGPPVLVCIYPVYRCFVALKCVDGTIVSQESTDKNGYPAKIGATHWMPLPPAVNKQDGQ